MKRQKGFSLIELLIVVAIILIIAAIAIPNLLKSRMSAQESSAAGTLRTYNTAMVSYYTQCPTIGYPADLTKLGPGAGDCTGANLVDNVLGGAATSVNKSGYTFTYAVVNSGGLNGAYTINANPLVCGSSGIKTFYTDQTAVIRGPQSNTSTSCTPATGANSAIQ